MDIYNLYWVLRCPSAIVPSDQQCWVVSQREDYKKSLLKPILPSISDNGLAGLTVFPVSGSSGIPGGEKLLC